MGKPTGFLDYGREEAPKRSVEERVLDFREFEQRMPTAQVKQQSARCMDCGIPFCHAHGCPVENRIPEWIDLVYREHWHEAYELLESTDNFSEFTGRVCPAPCEAACTLGINQPAVTIRNIELEIIEHAYAKGWVKPRLAGAKTGCRVAVIGSGPAGLACAQELARKGHDVVVFERDDRIGGLLRYGIPDFKLEKAIIDRRVNQLIAEGVRFRTRVNVGVDEGVRAAELRRQFDAIAICVGAGVARDLTASGRELLGIHYAMNFLSLNNRRVAGDSSPDIGAMSARGKHVVVLGGGDTGSDCVGTSIRQGAKSVTQIEILPRPPESRSADNPWPEWPRVFRTSSSQEEGCERLWNLSTRAFRGESGHVSALELVEVEWQRGDDGKMRLVEVAGSERVRNADLVLLAMGFVHPEHGPLVKELGLKLDGRGNVAVGRDLMTSETGVFAAGDAVLGASLVVRAIRQGRDVAAGVNRFLASGDVARAAAAL